MTMVWLRRWLAFFRANTDYAAYCQARADSDGFACANLEGKFSRIAELYFDWGDLRAVHAVRSSQSFEEWQQQRYALFFDDVRVRAIHQSSTHVHLPGHLLLDIPLASRQGETLKAVETFIRRTYQHGQRIVKESTVPAMRLALQPLPVPKYRLHAPNGKISMATASNLRKALYVNKYRNTLVNGKTMSVTATVLAIKQDAKNPLGWVLTSDDEDALKRGTFAKSILGGSEVTIVKRHRKDFDAYVRNTIHGRFPDNS